MRIHRKTAAVQRGHAAIVMALALGWSMSCFAQIGESRINTAVWNTFASDWRGFAFESVYPGTMGPNGCLSGPGTVTIALQGGTVQVSLASGACPIRDESGALAVSDAYVDQDDTLTMRFDPPVHAFFTTYGSVATGRAMSMRVKSADGRVDHLMEGIVSTTGALGTGHGFNSRVPIQTIEFTTGEAGTSVVGHFVGLVSGHGGLGTCEPGRGIDAVPCDFGYAYATTLPEGMLLQPDGVRAWRVDIDGGTAVVGTDGTVSIFERNAGGPGNWGIVRKLTRPAGADAQSLFGSGGVGIDGDTVAVGARQAVGSSGLRTGRVYLYGRNSGGPGNWGAAGTLDTASLFSQAFGATLAIDGNRIVVGDPTHVAFAGISGMAYLFERNAGNWSLARIFQPPTYAGATQYAVAVDVSGDSVAIGAPNHPLTEMSAGRVFVYERDTGGANAWGLSGNLVFGEPEQFGRSVALQVGKPGIPDRLVVGAPQHAELVPGGSWVGFCGWALGYQHRGGPTGWQDAATSTRWYQQLPAIPHEFAGFGVAMTGRHVYVSAPNSGLAHMIAVLPPPRVYRYPFDVTQGTPVGVAMLRPDGAVLDDVAGPIAADGNDLLVTGLGAVAWIISDPIFGNGFE